MIIFGTVLGKLGVLDSSTMSFIGMFDSSSTEVAQLFYNKREFQLISISNTGDVNVWDAQKMEILQSMSSKSHMRLKYISTSIFHQGSGTLLLATQKVFKYNLRVDHDTKIQIDKQHTVSQTYLKQLKKTLLRTRQLKKADDIQEEDGAQEKDQDRMVNRD